MIRKLQIALFLVCSSMFAQTEKRPTCATMEHLEYLKQENPQLEVEMKQYNAQIEEWIVANQQQLNRGFEVVTIPVVFHVLYNTAAENLTDAQVKSQLDAMNADFMGTNTDAAGIPTAFKSAAGNPQIQFCLAQRDPAGKATTGIIHKSTTKTSFSDSGDPAKFSSKGGDDAWDTKKYFNFWICDLGSSLIGYAEFPKGTATNTFGVVSNYKYTGTIGAAKPFDKGRIGAHEGGHCFNLIHIWGDANCGNDNVSDTPTQKAATSGCPTFPTVTCSNSAPNGDMFMNFMDYTDDVCLSMFTKGQATRMVAVVNTLPYSALKTSNGCEPPVNTGITILAADNDLTVYPNPNNGVVTIAFTPTEKSTRVEIQNLLGQVLYKEEVVDMNAQYSKSIDMHAFGKGIYTVHLRNKTGEVAKKIIVE